MDFLNRILSYCLPRKIGVTNKQYSLRSHAFSFLPIMSDPIITQCRRLSTLKTTAFRLTFFALTVCLTPASLSGQDAEPARPHDEEIREIRQEALRLVRERDFEAGYALLLRQEARAREVDDAYWLYLALWEQALHYARLREPTRAIQLYEEAYQSLLECEKERVRQWFFRLMLLNNLQLKNRSVGRFGEMLRLHRLAEDAAKEYLAEVHGIADPQLDLYDLDSPHLAVDFPSRTLDLLVLHQSDLREHAGEHEASILLLQRMAEKLENIARHDAWTRLDQGRAYSKLIWQLNLIGRTSEADDYSQRLLELEGVRHVPGYHLLRERVHAARRAIRAGEPPEEFLPGAEEAVRQLREGRYSPAMFEAESALIRIYAFLGRNERALSMFDDLIEEMRDASIDLVLAHRLMDRAELRITLDKLEDVEADLFEAIRFLRESGMWIDEIRAYRIYSRYLAKTGRATEALRVANRGLFLAERFNNDSHRGALQRVRDRVSEAIDADLSEALVDLQPIQMTATVAANEFARGRFVVINPGITSAEGTLEVQGRIGAHHWNAGRGAWAVEILPEGEETLLSRRIVVEPGKQVVLFLETAVNENNNRGEATITWNGREDQTATWSYDLGPEQKVTSLVTGNLAMENPFFPMPMYHEIYYRGGGDDIRNIRVRSSHPARIELVDGTTRNLLAVDATGDGAFDGPGDILLVDTHRNNFPELMLKGDEGMAIVELYVFPHAAEADQIEIGVELLEENGWTPLGTSTLVPTRVGKETDP